MRKFLRNRGLWIVVFVIIFLGFLINITAQDSQVLKKIQGPFIRFLGPVKNVFAKASFYIKDKVEEIPQLFSLKNENKKLRKQVAELKQYKQTFEEYRQENKTLRDLLDLKQKNLDYDLEAAEVIGRDPGNWFNVIMIDKGKYDGIKENMAVISGNGLVGHVISSDKNFSKVLLITDDRSSISAMIQRTRDNGILKGTIDPAPQGCVKMVFLPQNANIVKGDTVISSGLGGIIPKGIVIGEVVEAKKEPYELMQYAIIKPTVDFQKLEHVFVIKNSGGGIL